MQAPDLLLAPLLLLQHQPRLLRRQVAVRLRSCLGSSVAQRILSGGAGCQLRGRAIQILRTTGLNTIMQGCE